MTSDRPGPTLVLVVAASLVGAVLASWPLAWAPATTLPGLPGAEATEHLWALWVGARAGPLIVDTTLLDFPRGMRWIVADPLNLAWFAMGRAWGPVAGFAAVQIGNLALGGLGVAALWRWMLGGGRAGAVLGAGLGPCLPVLAGGLFTGMTEAQTMGWVAVATAATWRAGRDGGGWLAGAALALGACAWAGPYTGLYAAMAAVVVGAAGAWTAPDGARRGALRVTGVALAAALLASPVAWALAVERPEMARQQADLPGASSLVGAVLAQPDVTKNLLLSGDALGLVWPGATPARLARGGVEAVSATHSSYLGVTVLLLAAVGAWRRRSDPAVRALLGAVALLVVLGLGYHIQAAGGVVRVAGRPLVAPAAFLSAWLPGVGRAARWYRAHIPAGVLLLPVALLGLRAAAERFARRPVAAGALACVVLLDLLGAGALPWPRPVFSGAPPAGWAELQPAEPILEVPLPRSGAATRLRASALVWQAWSGQPIGGNPLGGWPEGTDPRVIQLERRLRLAVEREEPAIGQSALRDAQALGFGWLVARPAGDAAGTRWPERLAGLLGPPEVSTPDLTAWRVPPAP